jgi:hypothetical protein
MMGVVETWLKAEYAGAAMMLVDVYKHSNDFARVRYLNLRNRGQLEVGGGVRFFPEESSRCGIAVVK